MRKTELVGIAGILSLIVREVDSISGGAIQMGSTAEWVSLQFPPPAIS